jgi:DNA (cytosine-5)-methyltransferase 1
MSWLFSQALVAASSEANCSDGEPFAQLSVMPTQAKFWRNDKTMEFSSLSRFGLTLQLLTESHGEELLTWYLAGFHAKTLAQQEKVQESKAQEAECGKKWHGLLAKYDPLTHSWKTAQCSLLEGLEQSLQTWPRWGMMRNGECYLRPMLAHLISEKESGLLPNNETFFHTPNTTGLDGGSNSRKALKKRMMPTPVCQDSRHAQSRHLDETCKHWESNLGEVFVAMTGILKMPPHLSNQ